MPPRGMASSSGTSSQAELRSCGGASPWCRERAELQCSEQAMLRCGEQAGLPRCEREVLRFCEHAATRARGVPAGGTQRTCIEPVYGPRGVHWPTAAGVAPRRGS